jgi:transposase-like protein
VLVWCKACRHQADANPHALVDAGRGDVALIKLRFRCSNCGSHLTDFVVTSRDNPQPWQLIHAMCGVIRHRRRCPP